ncbi:DUF6168 family protein [Gilvibacter sp.]|uniref:DUF6168 family protein n=1 Tax=Gilvibacter sp. TaxID=2729997 RepID=UPI0035BE3A5C
MIKTIVQFATVLLGTLGLSFGLHLLALDAQELPLFANKIVLTYLVNAVLALIIYGLILRSLEKQAAQAGFIFLIGSALKFLVFFLVFYPAYKADGEMQTLEFVAFFVPYGISLLVEVLFLSRKLNKQ